MAEEARDEFGVNAGVGGKCKQQHYYYNYYTIYDSKYITYNDIHIINELIN